MWTYKIFNSSKILHYAIIKNTINGVRLNIPYKDFSKMSKEAAEKQIIEIVNKLNK